MSSREMEFFEMFAWALPKAFKDPLSICRFEQGDVLYDTRKAYQVWKEALKYLRYGIQVKFPERSTSRKAEQEADSVFSSNWNQKAVIELTKYSTQTQSLIDTTQGRLYSALWKGNLDILSKDYPDPSIPELPKTLLKNGMLPLLEPYICKLSTDDIIPNPTVFVVPYDETRDIYRNKFNKVKYALEKHVKLRIKMISPEQAGLSHPNEFVPTLSLAFFLVENSSQAEVIELVKKALYVPPNGNQPQKEQFRINAHGYLYPEVERESMKAK